MNPEAKKLWKLIRNENCTECPLHESAQAVCLIGDGPVPCRLMIVGEAPGYREDQISRPFSGRSGQLLDAELTKVGLDRKDIFVTNAVKCRPPENKTPTRGQQKTCFHYFEDEIEHVQPEFILLLGNTALNVIKKSGIMKHRGELFQLGEATVLATVHPAAVLRNPRFEQLFRTDLGTWARLSKGASSSAKRGRSFLCNDRRAVQQVVARTLESSAVAYDLETSGTEDFHPEAQIATIAIATEPGLSFVIPIHHPEARWKDPQKVLDVLGRALAYTKAKRIAHNAKFDDRWLQRFGAHVEADFDTMLAAHMLDENRFKGLKPLSQMLLGVDPWKDIDFSKESALTTPLKPLARYNAKDADYTLRLYYLFREQLLDPAERRTLRLFKLLIMPASRAITQIERNGIWVDNERLAKRRIEVNSKLEEINKALIEETGEMANWNSPMQIAAILFDQMGLPLLETTAAGRPSTKESVLLRLRHDYPVCQLLLDWRKYAKYNSTYLTRWAEIQDQNSRIHPNYKIAGTVTGRLSSGKEEGSKGRGLNVQQVPRDPFIRGILGAPPGWKFVEADFSQIELRIAAHYANEPTLLRIFNMGGDPHMTMAMKMTGKPKELVTSEERKKAKAVNFGFLFGMGWKKFIDYARDNYDVVVTEAEARRIRDQFFEQYAALQAWHERQRRLVRRYHRVQSLIGRVRHLPDIMSEDKEVAAEAERQAINSPVQGLASDMMLLAMVILHDKVNPKEVRIVGTVHDSLLFEIREDVVDKWVPVIKDTMENLPMKKKFGVELKVPITVDIKVGQHWSETEEVAA